MTDPTRRTEADLRAAFALAALDAPTTTDVLARLDASERTRPRSGRRRSWWPVAAVAAAVVVIAVPIGFAVAHGGGSTASSSSRSVGSFEATAAATAGGSSAAGSAIGGPAISGPATSGAANGAIPPVVSAQPSSGPSAGRVCTPADVSLTLAWTQDSGSTTGRLTATNHGSTPCDLAVKPSIDPLGTDGKALNVPNVVSAEGYAGPSRLLAGASASSSIAWMSWCGAPASNRAEIDWGTGTITVTVTGPVAPACRATLPAGNTISSGWFGPLS